MNYTANTHNFPPIQNFIFVICLSRMGKTIGIQRKRKSVGIKRKGGSGRNNRERITPKNFFHGNGKEDLSSSAETSSILETTNKTPDVLLPTIDDPAAVVQDAPSPVPQTKNTSTFNNPTHPTPTPVTSFVEDGRTLFTNLFEKEQLSVEKLCAEQRGETLIVTFEVPKEAWLRYTSHCSKNSSTGILGTEVKSIDFDAYKSDGRNDQSAKRAQQRATSKIVDAIEKAGSEGLQILALHKAVAHPRIRLVSRAAGINLDAPLLQFQRQNAITIIEQARVKQGRGNNERIQFLDSLLVAFSANPDEIHDYSLSKQAKLLGLKKTAGIRLLQKASKKRKQLVDTGKYEVMKTKSKRQSRYSDAFLKSLTEWVTNHPFVRVSPITNDTLLLNGTRYPKLLREVPIRELHNDMIKDTNSGGLHGAVVDGKAIMSDTELRRQLKRLLPELRKATLRHKKMCGCENCIGISYVHDALNQYQLRKRRSLEDRASSLKEQVRSCDNCQLKRQLETKYLSAVVDADDYSQYAFLGGEPLHPKPRNALDMIMCLPVQTCKNMRQWKCVLGKCIDCPKAHFHRLEQSTDDSMVRFQHYQKYTKCTKHGMLELRSKKCDLCDEEVNSRTKAGLIRTRSELTLSETTIDVFLKDFYLPLLERYRYHLPHVQILSKHMIGTKRHDAFKSLLHSLFTKRDFAEAIQAAMHNEVQGDHFGKIRKMILEGCCVEYFLEALGKLTKEFHSHLSDDAGQSAATSFENMYIVLLGLKENGLLHEYSTVIYDHTDGCTSQYRCATACSIFS